MKVRRLAFSLLLLFPLVAIPASADDARAAASRAISIMGGEAWEKARYVAFTFSVERGGAAGTAYRHRWDRYTGEYFVAGKDREGHQYEVRMNVNSRKGTAMVDGAASTDPKWVEMAYRRFINDTYWLLMPLKMLDPGSKLEWDGTRTDECGRSFDVLKLSFESGVGLTSKDQYWPWIHRDTGLVERWDMLLEGHDEGEKPTSILFRSWSRIGGVLISTRREMGTALVRFDDITLAESVPAGAL